MNLSIPFFFQLLKKQSIDIPAFNRSTIRFKHKKIRCFTTNSRNNKNFDGQSKEDNALSINQTIGQQNIYLHFVSSCALRKTNRAIWIIDKTNQQSSKSQQSSN